MPAWLSVSKVRCLTVLHSGGHFSARVGTAGEGASCAVELTDVVAGGRQWWTLAFEASGSDEQQREALERAASIVLSEPMPDGVELRTDQANSYAGWLRDHVR
jgi:hypothetical protein